MEESSNGRRQQGFTSKYYDHDSPDIDTSTSSSVSPISITKQHQLQLTDPTRLEELHKTSASNVGKPDSQGAHCTVENEEKQPQTSSDPSGASSNLPCSSQSDKRRSASTDESESYQLSSFLRSIDYDSEKYDDSSLMYPIPFEDTGQDTDRPRASANSGSLLVSNEQGCIEQSSKHRNDSSKLGEQAFAESSKPIDISSRFDYLQALNSKLKECLSTCLSYEQQLEMERTSRASFDALNGPFMDARSMHKHFLKVTTTMTQSPISSSSCSSGSANKSNDKHQPQSTDKATALKFSADNTGETSRQIASTSRVSPEAGPSTLQSQSELRMDLKRLHPPEVSDSTDSSESRERTYAMHYGSTKRKYVSDPDGYGFFQSDTRTDESSSKRRKESGKRGRVRKRRKIVYKQFSASSMSKKSRKLREIEFVTEITALRIEHADLQRKYEALELRNKRLESHIRSSICQSQSPAESNEEQKKPGDSGNISPPIEQQVLSVKQPLVDTGEEK